MNKLFRTSFFAFAIIAVGLLGRAELGHAAAGSPPKGPIDPVVTGAHLKFACGQEVDGFKDIVGEEMYRSMLIVQCRAFVGAIAEMIKSGDYAVEGEAKWQCIDIPEDLTELSTTFVTWVGRKPALMRAPAATALIEAVEMSKRCK